MAIKYESGRIGLSEESGTIEKDTHVSRCSHHRYNRFGKCSDSYRGCWRNPRGDRTYVDLSRIRPAQRN